MNEISVKTIRYFTSGTPAYRTSCSIPVKNHRILVMEITLRGAIIFPDTTNFYVRIKSISEFPDTGIILTFRV